MIRTTVGKTLLLAAVVLGTSTAVFNCARSSSPQKGDDVGSVTVALTLSNGVIVNTVTYVISGNGITPIPGTIDVTNSSQATALVTGLPTANNYLITMDATSTDGLTTCHGTANFNVQTGQTAMANVILQCHGPGVGNTGTVAIDGRLDNCPFITGFSASSLQATVGSSIMIGVSATDLDPADTVTFSWTASPTGIGTFGNATAANTTFTCTAVGSTSLLPAISDGVCGDTKMPSIPVTCLAPTGGIGGSTGTGGAGTGGAGTGGAVAGTGGAGTGGAVAGTGGAGTGGAVIGTGGMTGIGGMTGTGGTVTCVEATSGDTAMCTQCTSDNCSLGAPPAFTDGCCGLPVAADQVLCLAAAACFSSPASACTVGGDATNCFCGTAGANCFATPGLANGPCVAQVQAAAKSMDPPTIHSVFTSSVSPLGRAVNVLGCQGVLCQTECSIR